jgi:hypothetical protein
MNNTTYTSASAAMHAAYELSQLIKRPVWRHITRDRRGAPLWYISLNETPLNALQDLTA